MPGLLVNRGTGGGDVEDDESDGNEICKYFHLQACGPGGVADADGGFAEKLLEACKKFSLRKPVDYIELPRDILRVKWSPGEITNPGGDDYLVPMGADYKSLLQKQIAAMKENIGSMKKQLEP